MTSIIVACDSKLGIGRDGTIPWHIPEDLALFKRLTWGHHIVMGRRTYESIGRCLPGRTSLVVTRSDRTFPQGCERVASLTEALEIARSRQETECFIIGGGMLYREALPRVDRLYVSFIEGDYDCDVYFPPLDYTVWEERIAMTVAPGKVNTPGFVFRVFDRRGHPLPLPTVLTEWVAQR